MTKQSHWRVFAITLLLLTAFASLPGSDVTARRQATPTASCDSAATPTSSMGTPMAGMDHGAMGMPAMAVEFDQSYIDMMIPHHMSIIALAQAAAPRLTDERLITLADEIISAQAAEIDELSGYREQFYGSPDPMPVDESAMMGMMGGMSMSMDEMMLMMDAEALVATYCTSADPNLAFIDLTIPHHESGVAASEVALLQSTHAEIRALAERVIMDQRREIDELTAIRQDLYGMASPQAIGASTGYALA